MSNSFQLQRRGICLVLSAPSGAGKTSLLHALLAQEPGLALSVSCTTRPPRPNEHDGQHYHFIDQARFDALVHANQMLEHATVHGRSYGTPRAPVEAALNAGQDIAFDIDWQGHQQLRAALPEDTVSVFLLPPSLEALRDRLHLRATDTPEEILRRLDTAREELAHWTEFDHIVVNAALPEATATVHAILQAARTLRARQMGMLAFVKALA